MDAEYDVVKEYLNAGRRLDADEAAAVDKAIETALCLI